MRDPSRRSGAQDFACGLLFRPAPSASSGSRRKSSQKCNEALSRDLWPLDPFESAPMRATSSGMGYCIPCAIQSRLEIKELAELLGGKTGRNSLTLKKLLGGIFREVSDLKFAKPPNPNLLRSCNRLRALF